MAAEGDRTQLTNLVLMGGRVGFQGVRGFLVYDVVPEGRACDPCTYLYPAGMGEPLANLEAVSEALEVVTCPLGLHLSKNKVRSYMF